ncbi:MAG: 5'/3'-nucleotidase SurE [Thermoleophilaceae bacterium]
MRVLLTNDDGIGAAGLNVMRRALLELPGIELSVIAPNSNRSAIGRSITTRSPLWVEEIEFADGSTGYATDGTPVDCVRFAALGLVGHEPELIVSGINHGSNLGDDITYSGTVAAALEGLVLGVPARGRIPAVSARRDGLPPGRRVRLRAGRRLRRAAGRGDRRRSAADGIAAERQLPGRRGCGARGCAASASASTATGSSSTRSAAGAAATASTETTPATRRARAPTSPRWPRG